MLLLQQIITEILKLILLFDFNKLCNYYVSLIELDFNNKSLAQKNQEEINISRFFSEEVVEEEEVVVEEEVKKKKRNLFLQFIITEGILSFFRIFLYDITLQDFLKNPLIGFEFYISGWVLFLMSLVVDENFFYENFFYFVKHDNFHRLLYLIYNKMPSTFFWLKYLIVYDFSYYEYILHIIKDYQFEKRDLSYDYLLYKTQNLFEVEILEEELTYKTFEFVLDKIKDKKNL